jgi:large subunit ribosomal protein L25
MTLSLTAKKRETGKAEELRIEGKIPGVLYGPEIEPVSIALDYNVFEKLYREAGESTLIDFTVEGDKEPTKVLVQATQIDPVKRTISHVDLRQIRMGVEMSVTVELNFVGEAPAVKELGGTLVKAHDSVNVKCLPKDLVSSIDVDLSTLTTFDDSISIKDLKLPEGIVVTDNPEGAIAKVSAPLTEDQLKALEEAEAPSVEDVEVEGDKKDGSASEAGEEKKDGPVEEKKDEGEKKE